MTCPTCNGAMTLPNPNGIGVEKCPDCKDGKIKPPRMKKTALILAISFQAILCSGQTWSLGTPLNRTTQPNYLLVWNEIEDRMYFSGGNVSPGRQTVTKSQVFNRLEDVLSFLNTETSGYFNSPDKKVVNIPSENIVGIWDLRNAGKIEITLKTEKKRREKEVVIEADEWEDNYYIIKN